MLLIFLLFLMLLLMQLVLLLLSLLLLIQLWLMLLLFLVMLLLFLLLLFLRLCLKLVMMVLMLLLLLLLFKTLFSCCCRCLCSINSKLTHLPLPLSRPKSPHMNNEEAIELSHYPDGRAPSEHGDAGRAHPIERDDFPAPPYAYATPGGRRRHWSEPSSTVSRRSSGETTPVQSSDEEDEEAEAAALADPKLDRTEEELKKMGQGAGMGQIFLKEIEAERERRKQARHRMLDPRSAARTPTARKEPHFRLRYDSPIGASPSRIADHLRPWDDELVSCNNVSNMPHLLLCCCHQSYISVDNAENCLFSQFCCCCSCCSCWYSCCFLQRFYLMRI